MPFLGPLLIVYVVWGSTYLGLKVGLEALPPLTLNAVRFLTAGLLLFAYCRYRRWPIPDRRQLRAGAIQGLLLPAAGTGGATWAEQSLPSGTTALLLATIPLWIVLGRRVFDREKISLPVALGLVAGIAGVALLVRPAGAGDAVATAVALGGALCWGLGTVYALHAPRPQHALMASAVEMISAGLVLGVIGLFAGEFGRTHVSGRSLLALGYLIVFGSLIAYTAYTWLLDHVAPRIAGTYAFVNPVVAVLLGWWLLNEKIDTRTVIAAAVIATGVALIVLAPSSSPPSDSAPPDPAAPGLVTPDPAAPGLVTPDPVTPGPVTPDPAAPDPVTPGPVTPGLVTFGEASSDRTAPAAERG
jgi:drug/metabolite transporter (DMT)-like permease